jgi:hypothetical protein
MHAAQARDPAETASHPKRSVEESAPNGSHDLAPTPFGFTSENGTETPAPAPQGAVNRKETRKNF